MYECHMSVENHFCIRDVFSCPVPLRAPFFKNLFTYKIKRYRFDFFTVFLFLRWAFCRLPTEMIQTKLLLNNQLLKFRNLSSKVDIFTAFQVIRNEKIIWIIVMLGCGYGRDHIY